MQLKIYGLFWTELEFIERAIKAEHLRDPLLSVRKELRDAVSYKLNSSDYEIASERAKFLSFWTKPAQTLDAEERALKQSLDPTVANAVAKKHILVFKELLEATKFRTSLLWKNCKMALI